MFEVVGYESRCIFVRCRKTGKSFRFAVADDGSLTHGETCTDQREPRRVAFAYLSRLRRTALTTI
jgi:hypothetical protein